MTRTHEPDLALHTRQRCRQGSGDGLTQKEQLADELARAQPHLFASFLVQHRLGVCLAKMDFLLDILLIGFQAMKESGQTWPLITEDEQDRQMARLVTTVRFVAGADEARAPDTKRQGCSAEAG